MWCEKSDREQLARIKNTLYKDKMTNSFKSIRQEIMEHHNDARSDQLNLNSYRESQKVATAVSKNSLWQKIDAKVAQHILSQN